MPEPAPMPGAEVLSEPLRSRWSPSVFDPEHQVGDEHLDALLRAAQWAPSFGNSQPWSFVALRRGSEGHALFTPHLSRGNGWVRRASVVFVTTTKIAPAPGEEKSTPAEYAYYDLGQAAAHITLQARALGLHAHQFAGFDRDAVRVALGVPEHHAVMTGIAIGARLPDALRSADGDEALTRDLEREERPRTRRPLEDVVHHDRWSDEEIAAIGATSHRRLT
ncbi:nitroreductase family protein [Nocardioides sp. R-C-SC26]|uniref:nitroreductase family protein n=1 Tax=Nocardioides sp. R-C-SC26 TaxID=2870414 RepID=UPI001E457BCF|nr:nitroreductase family protein [Nocardioides sp. R-C-SC26]